MQTQVNNYNTNNNNNHHNHLSHPKHHQLHHQHHQPSNKEISGWIDEDQDARHKGDNIFGVGVGVRRRGVCGDDETVIVAAYVHRDSAPQVAWRGDNVLIDVVHLIDVADHIGANKRANSNEAQSATAVELFVRRFREIVGYRKSRDSEVGEITSEQFGGVNSAVTSASNVLGSMSEPLHQHFNGKIMWRGIVELTKPKLLSVVSNKVIILECSWIIRTAFRWLAVRNCQRSASTRADPMKITRLEHGRKYVPYIFTQRLRD